MLDSFEPSKKDNADIAEDMQTLRRTGDYLMCKSMELATYSLHKKTLLFYVLFRFMRIGLSMSILAQIFGLGVLWILTIVPIYIAITEIFIYGPNPIQIIGFRSFVDAVILFISSLMGLLYLVGSMIGII